MIGDGVDVLDSVVDKEDLSSPLKFSLDSLSDDVVIVTGHNGANGQAILWGGLNEAMIPDP